MILEAQSLNCWRAKSSLRHMTELEIILEVGELTKGPADYWSSLAIDQTRILAKLRSLSAGSGLPTSRRRHLIEVALEPLSI